MGRDSIISTSTACGTHFNPRARVGRDFAWRRIIDALHIFQSTRPSWGATHTLEYNFAAVSISIHAPRVGRDQADGADCTGDLHFNPRAPCGARRSSDTISIRASRFQSMRPVWGATRIFCRTARAVFISIHAPAWGATLPACPQACPAAFQSTRPRGARLRVCNNLYHLLHFNPRARVGRDSIGITTSEADAVFQSTRPRGARLDAPAFGDFHGAFQSTRPRDIMWRSAVDFNPRARVGRDSPSIAVFPKLPLFQSTRPRGARQKSNITKGITRNFNPRARVGRDDSCRPSVLPVRISIHAPAWGATVRAET